MKREKAQSGESLILVLLLVTLVSLILTPFFGVIAKELGVAKTRIDREEALQIAEAGIDYYQWHLAHYPTDYQDGTGKAGPYVHTYTDLTTQKIIGYYSLTITPPPTGSTIVTIQSTAWTTDNPNVRRVVTAKYGIPSLALYSFLSNDIIWIGSGETVSGEMQSNNGVRFDGSTNAPVMSAKSTYTCPSSQGSPCPTTENGVWGSANSSVKAFWQYPVPAVDFSSLTSNLATLKSTAQSETGGTYYLPPSNASGYSLVLNSNGTVSIYKVTSLQSEPTGWDVNNNAINTSTDYKNRTLLYSNEPIPASGIIYIEDKVWVEGTVKGRVMVAAAVLPYNSSTAPSIFIPNNIVYAAKDGTNSLGLLAQQNVIVSYAAPQNLEIDGALIAQNGSAEFLYYQNMTAVKTKISVFGSIMTYGQWTWTWIDNNNNDISGYATTNDAYDSSLMYSPPPSFPFSSAGYKQLSWYSN
ncbi:MAG: hypothetical protein P4L81_01965 [Candidatus Pacebacteria bacterium]|nr:hypothetical protein [Candidatus Paceibacterota bacterium]